MPQWPFQHRQTSELKPFRHVVATRYYAIMPTKKHHRILIWVVFLCVATTIAGQMLYPPNRAVPFARLGSESVGWKDESELSQAIGTAFQQAKIRLTTDNRTVNDVLLSTTGAEPRTTDMAISLVEYPFWQRFVPGSLLWQRPSVSTWRLDFAATPLRVFCDAQSKELTYDAVNASLQIKDGILVATNEQKGSHTTTAQIADALKDAKIAYGGVTPISVTADTVKPTKTAADLSDVRSRAEAALSRSLMIQANARTFTPTAAEKALWLQLADDVSGATTLSISVPALNAYLDSLSKEVGTPAGQTDVTIKDGQEVSRVTGTVGSKISNQPLVDLIQEYLLNQKGRSPFIAEFVSVEPTIIYNKTYTATEAGLRAYITEQAKNGAWISIRQLDGMHWSADADATDSVVSGSTFKLFVALYLFKEMDEGKRDWTTPILDTDTTTCFDRMTIASTNPCADEWLRQFGRTNVNAYLYNRGFSHATTFTHPEAAHTSALDLTTYMIGLEQGTLMSGTHRDRLLYSLSHHPYRYGIPTGSKGQVWDKVGFLWDYVNDTAIVHHPKGTYVMTIMTQGKSYAAIASMTRDIERIMYP